MTKKLSKSTKKDIKEYAANLQEQLDILINNGSDDDLLENSQTGRQLSGRLRETFNMISAPTDIPLIEHIVKIAPDNDMADIGEQMDGLLPCLKAIENDLSEIFQNNNPASFTQDEITQIMKDAVGKRKNLLPKPKP